MTNEVRKPPREFWAYGNMISIHREMFRHVGISEAYDSAIRLREVLPGDDSLRVSKEDWDAIRMMADNDYGGSILELMERIERESKGE